MTGGAWVVVVDGSGGSVATGASLVETVAGGAGAVSTVPAVTAAPPQAVATMPRAASVVINLRMAGNLTQVTQYLGHVLLKV